MGPWLYLLSVFSPPISLSLLPLACWNFVSWFYKGSHEPRPHCHLGCSRGKGSAMSSHRPLCRPRSTHPCLHGHRIVCSAALYFSYLIPSPLPFKGQGVGQMGCSHICLFQLSPRQALSPCWTVQHPEETHSQSTTKRGQLRV